VLNQGILSPKPHGIHHRPALLLFVVFERLLVPRMALLMPRRWTWCAGETIVGEA